MEGERFLYVQKKDICLSVTRRRAVKYTVLVLSFITANCDALKRAKYAARNKYSDLSPSLQPRPDVPTFGASF